MKKKFPTIKNGDIFDDLIVVRLSCCDEKYTKKYLVKCTKCGREKTLSRSCLIDHKGTTHKACGKGLKLNNLRFYHIWCGMRARTTNPNASHWDCYGGRGINSDEFENFIDFYDKMYKSYLEAIERIGDESQVSLDRIDVNGNYETNNLRWISLTEQKSNMRKNRLFKAIAPDGKIYIQNNQSAFAREHGLSMKQLNACLVGRFKTHLGWKFCYLEEV